ncbi:MAG: hypothetical protein WCO79_00650 [bacterium]
MNPGPEALHTPEQELAFLREQVSQKERELRERGEAQPLQERVMKEKLVEYQGLPTEKVLAPDHRLTPAASEAIVLNIAPEAHDEKMAELLAVLQKHGLKNALDVVEKLKNPHLEDDFHRFVIQYIKAGHRVDQMNPKEAISKALKMTLYEIALPERDGEAPEKSLKELVSSMEQFYSGMSSVADDDDTSAHYFTIELAVSNYSDEFVFYMAVPDTKRDLFEKQILGIFHNARITEKNDDYNIFSEKGVVAGSAIGLDKKPALPIKMYDQFDHDPLNVILNTFSKIKRDGEGAALQIVCMPVKDDFYLKRYRRAIERIEKGVKTKDAIDFPDTFFDHFSHIFKGSTAPKKPKEGEKSDIRVDDAAIEEIKRKLESPTMLTNVRLMVSADTDTAAERILSDMESAFNQFQNTQGNRFTFERMKKGRLQKFVDAFAYRLYDEDTKLALSLRELTTVMHLPATVLKSAPQLKISKAGTAPAPLDLPKGGILLGVNEFRNMKTDIHMTPEDRLRHFYVIGQTGTGKTSLLKNMIVQDIKNGDGVCFIDPHGSDIQDILAKIPKERYEDVIYFDPAYTERPMGLNMLQYDPRFPEQKTFVVNEMLSIFNKLFDMKTAGGPMFEQYFRNAVLLTIDDPSSGGTLLDVSRVLSSKIFREQKLLKCTNPVVTQFWREVAEKAGGESSLANIVPYVVSKFDTFLSNDIMRPVIAQEKSTFNFREIMDTKKILLVNLSKGRLGDINANLIGLILVGKILMAALSRADSLNGQAGAPQMPPFYLYIDEFQNVTTDSISVILSEARKYKLSLNIAHQFIAQLQEGIKNSVFGNVGSIAAFRVGAEDAEYLEKQFAPVFTAKDSMNVDNYQAYVKLLAGGRPVKPFSMQLVAPQPGRPDQIENLKQLSYMKFGRNKADVEAEILLKYQKKNA